MSDGLSRRTLILAAAALAAGTGTGAAAATDLILHTAEGRKIAVSVWRAKGRRRGTLIFSHGALSAPWKYAQVTDAWSAAGFDIYAPLHVDSTDHPDTALYKGLESWRARLEDVHLLADKIGRDGYVATGHSYGGLVALTLGGASAKRPDGYAGPMRDPRARAVVALSPPGAAPGLVDGAGYAELAVPAFVQTGSLDNPPASGPKGWKQHLLAYDSAAAGGNRYALVLDGVDHYFGGLICRPELPGPKQSAGMADLLRLSQLFLDGYGRNRTAARTALDRLTTDTGPARLSRK